MQSLGYETERTVRHMEGCMEARAAITIKEIPCPNCGADMEEFIRDGALAADARCEACGYTIPAGTHA